ncbi:MAG: dehydratase [Proteobacteria bacterium]|nr:dehydratase [Pseudomonadota bacterium]
MSWIEGQTIKEIKKGPLTADLLKLYGAAALDPNPIHLDPEFAKAAGYPSVIAHGMLSMAFLAEAIRASFPGADYTVEKFSSRFRKVTFPGDILTTKGRIKKVEGDILHLSLSIENQTGEITTQGEALIRSTQRVSSRA